MIYWAFETVHILLCLINYNNNIVIVLTTIAATVIAVENYLIIQK